MKQLNAQLRGLLVTLTAGLEVDGNDIFSLIDVSRDIARKQMIKAFDLPDWNYIFSTRRNNTILVYDEPEYSPTPNSIFLKNSVQGSFSFVS